MLSTPALSFRTSENQDNTIRKNGGGKSMQRKPFLDRPVNSKTSLTNKFSKSVQSLKNQQSSPKQQFDIDGYEYIFSFKDKENYECDVWPKPAKLSTEDIIRILRNYCSNNQSTPPPSPIHEPIEIDYILTNVEDGEKHDEILLESIDDVEIPHMDW